MAEQPYFELTRYSPPEKTTDDYSEAEKEQFRKSFKRVTARSRKFSDTALVALVVCLPLFIFSRNNSFRTPVNVGFISIVAFMFVGSVIARLTCPACKKAADDTVRSFYPECGGKATSGGLFYAAECPSCGKKLRRSVKGRRLWKIKYCTHCGILLTDEPI